MFRFVDQSEQVNGQVASEVEAGNVNTVRRQTSRKKLEGKIVLRVTFEIYEQPARTTSSDTRSGLPRNFFFRGRG